MYPQTTPSLESLEPRLLLNADFIGIEPLRTLDVQPCEQVIQVDRDQQNETIQEADLSLMLAYLASAEEPEETIAPQSEEAPCGEAEIDSFGVPSDPSIEKSAPTETMGATEFGVEVTVDSGESAAAFHEQSACRVPVDGQNDISETDGFPIEARGPPAESSDILSTLSATIYGEEDPPCAVAAVESVPTQDGTKAPELPGLKLVDPDLSNWQGQIIYLDFDGQQNVIYNGPVTVGPFDIPAFQAPGQVAGREAEVMADITAQLNDLFAATSVLFTLNRPPEEGTYSTIYIGGDGSWASEYGSFFGLAEQVDIGNLDRVDNAFVFADRLSSPTRDLGIHAYTFANLVAHEVGHLLGYGHEVDEGRRLRAMDSVAATPLEVPYYFQGSSSWCWATSLAMVLGYYGEDIKPWQVAAEFDKAFSQGIKGLEYGRIMNWLEEKFSAGHTDAWTLDTQNYDNAKIKSKLISLLSAGHPVWAASQEKDHAVVITGYDGSSDADHVYLHDPSGALVGGASEADLVHYEYTWADFLKAIDAEWLTGGGDLDMIYASPGKLTPPAFTRPASLQIESHDLEFSLTFWRGDTGGNTYFDGMLMAWDGTSPYPGYRYQPSSDVWPVDNNDDLHEFDYNAIQLQASHLIVKPSYSHHAAQGSAPVQLSLQYAIVSESDGREVYAWSPTETLTVGSNEYRTVDRAMWLDMPMSHLFAGVYGLTVTLKNAATGAVYDKCAFSFGVARSSDVFTITAVSGAHGCVVPDGDVAIRRGDNVTFLATPDDRYIVDRWYLDGVEGGSVTGLELENIEGSREVLVTFKLDEGEGLLTHNGPWSASPDQKFTIGGYVHDGLGNLISGTIVYARIDGSVIGQAETDESGYYLMENALAPGNSGEYAVSCETAYEGDLITATGVLTVSTGSTTYGISTVDEFLAYMSVSANYNKKFKLTADIDLAGRVFSTAIIAADESSSEGYQGTPFTGTFDGQGFRIRNIEIDTGGAGNDYLGLFGMIGEGGRVRNLYLTSGVDIQAGDGSSYVGGIAGYIDDGYIVNCSVSGDRIEAGADNSYLGRLAGYANQSAILNCTVAGSVLAGANALYVGGLIGDCYGTDITECSSIGNIRVETSSQYAGGLIGRASESAITDCYTTTGWVEGWDGCEHLGGLVGATVDDCVVRGCYSTGEVRSDEDSDNMTYVGGLVGYHTGDSEIIECYSTSTIVAADSSYVGGLTGGNNEATIRRSFYNGEITADDTVGGVTGWNYMNSTIANSYSMGTVSGSSSVGGIIGEGRSYSVVENCYSVASVSGGANIGGIIGEDGWQSAVIGCYFLDASGLANGSGTALTSGQMKQQASYAEWDFDSTWYINEGAGYPELRWAGIHVAAPAWVVASDGYASCILVEWASVLDSGFYKVYRSLSETGVKTELSSWIDSLSYVDDTAAPGTTYYYWVKAATDELGAGASDYSEFCTGSRVLMPNIAPRTPTGLRPADGATEVSITPTLEASAFSDPNSGDMHAVSQWQISTTDDFASLVWDSARTYDKVSIAVPAGCLECETVYYWRVRHQDSQGAWSDWSTPLSFTTEDLLYTATAYGDWAQWIATTEYVMPGEPLPENPYTVHNGSASILGMVAHTAYQRIDVTVENAGETSGLTGAIELYGADGEWDIPGEYPQESCGQAWGKLTGTFTPSAYPAGSSVILDLSILAEGDKIGDAEDYYFRIFRDGSIIAEILPGDVDATIVVTAGEELTYEMYAVADDFEPNAWQTSYDRAYEFTLRVGNAAGIISGGIWADLDGDGTWDKIAIDGGVREGGIEGWTVYLDRDNDGSWDDSTTTGEDGSYEFVGLPAGIYTVAVEVRGGWVQVYPAGDGSQVVILEAGATETGVNFGNLPPNLLYVDDDAPGDPNPGDPSVGDSFEDGSRSHPYDSVQEAIRYVALDGQVHVAAGRYGEVLTIDRRVSLYGGYDGANWDAPQDPDGNATIIDALGWGQSVVSIRTAELILDGFTLTNGASLDGGGVFCENGTVWIYRCNIIGNGTMDGGATFEDGGQNGGDGGGIYCIASTLTIQDSTISNNRTGRGLDEYGGRGGNGAGICAVESEVVILGCTVAGNTTGPGGTGDPAWSGGSGGGLYADSSMVAMTDCTIENNATGTGGDSQGGSAGQGGHGGGVYAISSTLEMNEGIVRGNVTGSGGDCQGYMYLGLGTGGFGGAFHIESSTFTGIAVLFESNSTGMGGYTAPGGHGGALYSSSSTVQLIRCTLIGNSTGRAGPANWPSYSGSGGALYVTTSSVDISDCVIQQNWTGSGLYCGGEESGWSGSGGGIYLSSCQFALIRNSRIIGNVTGNVEGGFIYAGDAGHGGGLAILGSATHIENCLISGNSTGDGASAEFASNGGSGGGVYCGPESTVAIVGCTIVGNSHGNKGIGVYEDGVDGQGGGICGNSATVIINSIIWGNLEMDLSGCSASNVSYCDVSDAGYNGTNHNISVGPRFVNPIEGDYRLHADSPCIDQGNNVAVSPVAMTDLDGNPRIGGMTVDLGAYESLRTPFRILDVETFPWGFVAQFNRPIAASALNLYDTVTAGYGPADVTVVGQTVGSVAGSLIVSDDGTSVTFIKTGSPLEADMYTITLRSAANGFRDTEGRLLDGDLDGLDGGNYVATMTVASATWRWVSVPDFARGPGQAVNVPATGSGIPIRISDGAGVQAVDFVLEYDPALLTITGVSLGAGLPADWSIISNLNTPGRVSVTVYGATALSAGERTLAVLEARVPEESPYASAGVLTLTSVQVNEGAIEARADSGIQVVAYLGDATGNHAYSGLDASYIARVSVGLDSGFAKYRMKDPVLIGDTTGNGKLSGLDASYMARNVVGLSQPQIPDLPGVLPPIVAGGVDPLLSVGCNATAQAGDPITLELLVDDAAGVLAADIVVGYDTAVLDLDSGAVSKGALTPGWTLVSHVDDSTGKVKLTLYGVDALAGGSGNLAKIMAKVREDASGGLTQIDLTEDSALNEGELVLTLADGQIEIQPKAKVPVAVNDRLKITLGPTRFDSRTGQTSVELAIRNVSATAIGGSLWLAIGAISDPGVSVVGAAGLTKGGMPYIDLSGRLDDGVLSPGEVIKIRVTFNNPLRKRFAFDPLVFGMM